MEHPKTTTVSQSNHDFKWIAHLRHGPDDGAAGDELHCIGHGEPAVNDSDFQRRWRYYNWYKEEMMPIV